MRRFMQCIIVLLFVINVEHRNKKLLTALLGAFFIVAASSVHAIPIKVTLTGSVADWDGSLGSQFTVGDALVAEYSYDSEAVDTDPDVSRGSYALSDFSGMLGGYAFSFISGEYRLLNGPTAFGDQIFVNAVATGANVGDAVLAGPIAFFRDLDEVFLSDDSLITVAPDLSVMEQTGFALAFDSPTEGRILVRANIEASELVSIPEPSTIILLGSGLFGVGIFRKRFRK